MLNNFDLIKRELLALNLSEPNLRFSVATIIFNPLFWNVIGRLEYHTKLFSKLTGGNAKYSCYFFAFMVFSLGIFRDYVFKLAIENNAKSEIFSNNLSKYIGLILMGLGNVFVLSSMWALGITGTYLGDHFGILMKSKLTGFPFNMMEHPMYQGASMIFLGYALWAGSFVGVLVSFFANFVYSIAGDFESRFTTMIYSKKSGNKFKQR